MRYFVLVGAAAGGSPYIAGEVVRERFDDGSFRDSSLGAALSIPGSLVLTRAELLLEPGGPQALADWAGNDDSEFDDQVDHRRESQDRGDGQVVDLDGARDRRRRAKGHPRTDPERTDLINALRRPRRPAWRPRDVRHDHPAAAPPPEPPERDG